MRFKSLEPGQSVEFRGVSDAVIRIRDWADGSRTVTFMRGGTFTRKANVLVSSI